MTKARCLRCWIHCFCLFPLKFSNRIMRDNIRELLGWLCSFIELLERVWVKILYDEMRRLSLGPSAPC